MVFKEAIKASNINWNWWINMIMHRNKSFCNDQNSQLEIFRNKCEKVDSIWKRNSFMRFEMSVHWNCKFDPFWTDLIQKKSKNKIVIFILYKNVTTFYAKFFWYLQPLRSFLFLQKDTYSLWRKHRQRLSNSSLDVNLIRAC